MDVRSAITKCSSVYAQVIFLIISLIITAGLFHKPLTDFNVKGRESFILKVTPEVIAKWGKTPEKVKVGFLIHEFLKFDVIKNDFLMNAVISFEFNPTKVKQEDIDKFAFTKGELVKKSDPVVKKISDDVTLLQYYIRIQFSTIFDYGMFPLDDHRMFLNLTNNALEAENVIFEVTPENFTVPKYVFLSGWKIGNIKPISGYAEFKSQENQIFRHPKVIFSMELKKTDARQLLLMLLPVLFVFYFSLFTLSFGDFDLNINAMVMLATAFMASAIVIQSMSPEVGYFMIIDYLVLFFLIAMFYIFFIHFLQLTEDRISKDTYDFIRGLSVIILYISFIAVIYYITHVY